MPCLKKRIFPAALLALGCASALDVHATEGGGTVYPLGVENFAAGAMPPPGLYGMVFGQHYHAGTLKDDAGNTVPLPFDLTANVVAPRMIWVTGHAVAGGNLAFHTIVPLVDLDVAVGPRRASRRGLGDITAGFSIGWHHGPYLHSLAGIDVFVSAGHYDKADLANIGRNYWATEPVYILSHIDPAGFNGDVKLGYLFNRTNGDTHVRSGQEFHFDYAAGWAVGARWTVGASGYYYRQTTADRQDGSDLALSNARAFAIGPSIKYDSKQGWFVTAKWQKETGVRNRAAGDALWLKAVFPL